MFFTRRHQEWVEENARRSNHNFDALSSAFAEYRGRFNRVVNSICGSVGDLADILCGEVKRLDAITEVHADWLVDLNGVTARRFNELCDYLGVERKQQPDGSYKLIPYGKSKRNTKRS